MNKARRRLQKARRRARAHVVTYTNGSSHRYVIKTASVFFGGVKIAQIEGGRFSWEPTS